MSKNIFLTLEDIVENNLNIYKSLMVECVIGTELLIHLPEINKDERNFLRSKQREHGHRKATEDLLDLISEKTDGSGRWTSFINALKQTDYEYISLALERDDVKDESKQRQIINIFAKYSQKSINPKEMLPSLRKKKIIQEQDSQEINAIQDARGPIAATIVLLDRIPRRKESWFEDFLDVLIENKRTDLVREIDEGYLENRLSIYKRKHQRPAENDDTDSDDSDGATAPKKCIRNVELRDYQKELAQPGLKGQNCIVVAPTGSGKTHVALKIIEEHMKQMRGRRVPKVIFIVEQSALAEQQGKMCKTFLQYSIKTITGEVQRRENYKELSEWLQRRDILVVTAQLLVNALVEGDVEITQFSLLVFDECHHTNLKHPFNRIMHYYLDIKLDENIKNKSLPQVLGLTASVGVGKAETKIAAVNWIEKMMAHLDAQELATVRRQKQQLAKFVTTPQQTTVTVKKRYNNVFEQSLNSCMAKIETIMVKKKGAKVMEFGKTLQPPSERGSGQYTQWLSLLWKETVKCYDQDVRRHFSTCRNYLECYNNTLIIYYDARVKDALAYLEQEVGRINETAIHDETDRLMEKMYQESKDLLENCLWEGNKNPKLEKLKELLIKTYTDEPDSRGIVFVKTRDLGKAIEAWMKETAQLRDLRPKTFFGAQASVEKGGMTKNEQEDVLKYFRDGKHRVIIATSVAEEGLDVQKCNLVIRYDYVTNEIAMVQSRGRGRADDSKYVLVAEKESKTVIKEELNLLRESMMQDAIVTVQDRLESDRQAFRNRMLNQQKEENIIRDIELRNRKGREMQEGQFELRCYKCNNFICMSSDVKKIMNAHHAIMSTDIEERISVKKVSRPQFVDRQIQSCVAKVTCKQCGMDLGNVSIYIGAQFPIIKIMSFVIVDSYGNKSVVKKWKQAPFEVSPLSSSDLQKRIQSSFKLLPH